MSRYVVNINYVDVILIEWLIAALESYGSD